MLVELAIEEPGELALVNSCGCRGAHAAPSSGKNWVNEYFVNDRGQHVPGWELPVSWPKDMPKIGTLRVTYTSARENGCCPDIECRQRILQRVRMQCKLVCMC